MLKKILIFIGIIGVIVLSGCSIQKNGCWLDESETQPTIKCIEGRGDNVLATSHDIYVFGFVSSDDEPAAHFLIVDRCNIVTDNFDKRLLDYGFMNKNYPEYCHTYYIDEDESTI